MRLAVFLALAVMPLAVSAQVIRAVDVDPITDVKTPFVVASSMDGRASLGVACNGPALMSPSVPMPDRPSTVLLRFDKGKPESISIEPSRLRSSVLLYPSDGKQFRQSLATASHIVVRVDGEPPTDLVFDVSADGKWPFVTAAARAGGDAHQAALAFDNLSNSILRAAAGQNATLVQLFAAMGLDWRKDGRARSTGELIGGIMKSLTLTKNPRTVEDMGHVLFGFGWTAVRPLALAKGEAAYSEVNRPFAAQLNWLEKNCNS